MDRVGGSYGVTLSDNARYAIVPLDGLYVIGYGAFSTGGLPGIVSIAYTPGGIDRAGQIPLQANAMASGTIIRRLGAQTRVSLWIDATNNNATVTLPASTPYANAYLTVAYVGPYPLFPTGQA